MVYLYLRPGELDALTLQDDVDLEHGVVHVHRATCGRTGREKVVKTGDTRRVAIEAELVPLLEAIHAEADGEGKVASVFGIDDNLARQLRNDLKLAGVTRKELFVEGDPTRKAMTFYDLRATGITWMALRGDNPLTIKQRAGHRRFETTEGYIREAENLRAANPGAPFPELPACLLGSGQVLAKAPFAGFVKPRASVSSAERAGFEPAAGF
jgi:integrase